jgi:hypothetical protein
MDLFARVVLVDTESNIPGVYFELTGVDWVEDYTLQNFGINDLNTRGSV